MAYLTIETTTKTRISETDQNTAIEAAKAVFDTSTIGVEDAYNAYIAEQSGEKADFEAAELWRSAVYATLPFIGDYEGADLAVIQ